MVSHALSGHYTVYVSFTVKLDSPQKQFVFEILAMLITERFAENMYAEIFLCSPPVSIPNENAVYMVNFTKNLMNKYFPI